MLKITESANVAHYVGCDWVKNAAVDFAAVFFSFYHQFPHIKYKYSKKGAKKGDKRTQKQRLQIHV